MPVGVFIPAPHEEERLRSGYNVVQEYRRRYEEEHAGEPWLEDTKGWYHNPNWRDNPDFWSLQRVRDKPGVTWTAVGALFYLAQIILNFGWVILLLFAFR